MRIAICLLTCILLGVSTNTPTCLAADPPAKTGDNRDTLLYVRTVPPGAKVLLDGKELGTSDNLFPVEPGVGKIVVELNGEKTEEQITIQANKVTRIELELRPKDGTPGQVIKDAVTTISQSAEGDPRVEQAMKSLRPLKQADVVKGLIPYLDFSYQETSRRAAIYILWKGKFADITPAVPTLEKLLGHEEVFTRGMAALALGQHKISSSYDAMAKMAAGDSSPYARRCAAIALGWLGDKRAEPVLEAASKDSDPLVRANARVGLDLLHGKEPDPLHALGDKPTSKAAGGGNAAQLTQEGWRLWQDRKLDEAAAKFRQAVKLDPKNQAAWNGLGWATFNSGNMPEAEQAFKRLVAMNPNHPAALNGLGQLYLAQKKYDLAEKHLLKAAPQAPAAWHGLARLYLIQGKFAQAEKYAQMIVDSGQGDKLTDRMLQAAKEKRLGDGLRFTIDPPQSQSEPATEGKNANGEGGK